MTGRGAITYGNRSISATFNAVDSNASSFYLHQTARIPKGGSATFHFAYAQAFDQKTVNSLARLSERRFRPCVVPKLKGKTLRRARRSASQGELHHREGQTPPLRDGRRRPRDSQPPRARARRSPPAPP